MHFNKYIIFNSEAEAILLNKTITDICFENHWTDGGKTNNYCDIIKHPTEDKWAVIIEKGYEKYFTELEIENAIELTEDWKPQFEMK